ncbi:MAG TPA: Ku protein [Casimicrobiaceae bacterium]|nr:Ku protein [Casimicrobiaceae bacterium]
MAARAIASLTLSFGLVSIPVKLYSATQASGAVSFNLLHKGCGSRLRQQYICQREGIPVDRGDTIKGYEFAKDQYVTFTSEELKEMEEKGTNLVEIDAFVPSDSIDPVYYDRAYFLGPDKGGDKPYALLAEAMRRSGRTAVARWAARGKQFIVQLRAVEGGIVMQQLLYAPEVRSIEEIGIPATPVRDQELALAQQLIDQISEERFDPAAYKDDVRERIEAAIERKIEGKQIEVAPTLAEPAGQVIDLMEALRASVQQKAAGKAPVERKAARKAAATPAAAPAQQRARAGRR